MFILYSQDMFGEYGYFFFYDYQDAIKDRLAVDDDYVSLWIIPVIP